MPLCLSAAIMKTEKTNAAVTSASMTAEASAPLAH